MTLLTRVLKYIILSIKIIRGKSRDHCEKYSNRWHWYNDKLKKIFQKQTNQRKDFQHKISKKIIENTKAHTIIIGDLNAKQMSRKAKGDKKDKKTFIVVTTTAM
ncbi:MAG: IS200/IS605 family element transposase accessory protein TnpB [Asgard group archaeon]|nr:IS200/IS605 family element transposase accessory protein TnpB [Asgard group archaeon]